MLQLLMLFFSPFFYYCTCNKLNKVKVAPSFREEIAFLFLRGYKELEPHL